jgi:hypothetical protein
MRINCNKRFKSMRAVSMHLKVAARHSEVRDHALTDQYDWAIGKVADFL